MAGGSRPGSPLTAKRILDAVDLHAAVEHAHAAPVGPVVPASKARVCSAVEAHAAAEQPFTLATAQGRMPSSQPLARRASRRTVGGGHTRLGRQWRLHGRPVPLCCRRQAAPCLAAPAGHGGSAEQQSGGGSRVRRRPRGRSRRVLPAAAAQGWHSPAQPLHFGPRPWRQGRGRAAPRLLPNSRSACCGGWRSSERASVCKCGKQHTGHKARTVSRISTVRQEEAL